MIVSGAQVLSEVSELGFRCWDPRDAKLFCPSESWLKEFAEYLGSIRKAAKRESWDCDDFAFWGVVNASESCSLALDTGHTFFYCTVRMWGALNGIEGGGGDGHATNLVRLDSGVYVFFEPQTGLYHDAKNALGDALVMPNNALL